MVGAAPLVRAMCEAIGLRTLIDQQLEWDEARCKLSPGERIQALILNILTGHQPLYRVWESFEDTDCELLLGRGVAPEDLNDDALARALDKLHAAGPARVFSQLALHVLSQEAEGLPRFLHWDSTTRSLFGEYPTATGEGAVLPTHGHSKDKRPDLKQIVLALLGTRDGLSLWGEIRDGNSSDKKANAEMIAELCRCFSPEELRQCVYVADSALVTGPNLQRLADAKLRFISRLPESFGVAGEVKAAAWTAGTWEALGTISPRRHAAEYWASEQSGVIEDRTYRLVVYRSSHLDARKARTFQKELDRERQALTEEAEALARQRFACPADADAAAQAWITRHADAWHSLTAPTVETQERQKRSRRGRPRKGEPPVWQTVYRLQPSVGSPDPQRLQAERQRRATFVLITDLPASTCSARELLMEYKAQVSLEQRFHFLKDPAVVDAFFLKKPERVEALGYVLLMACLVFSVLERRVRQANRPLPSPSRGSLANPTGYEILRHLRGIIAITVAPHRRHAQVSPRFRPAFRAILAMAGFSESVYTDVPLRNTG